MLRTMTIEDFDAVLAVWQLSELRIEPEDDRAGIDKFLQAEYSTGFVFVNDDTLESKSDEQILGAVLCGSDGRFGYIHHLAVHPAYRENGTGRALVDACVQFLKIKCCIRTVAVFVWDHNCQGIDFWTRSGFQLHDGLSVLSLTDFHP